MSKERLRKLLAELGTELDEPALKPIPEPIRQGFLRELKDRVK